MHVARQRRGRQDPVPSLEGTGWKGNEMREGEEALGARSTVVITSG